MNMENANAWKNIVGLDKAKEALEESVILPMKFPQLFEGNRQPLKGTLLYGPPGSGKTLLARSAATESGCSFFSVYPIDLIQKQLNKQSLIIEVFQIAKLQKPSLIFIDDIDELYKDNGENYNQARRVIIEELLQQIRILDSGIIVMAAVQQPWLLDAAVRRAFEKRIYFQLPDEQARQQMIQNSLSKNKHTLNHEQIKEIAKFTEGYSPSDISVLVRDALYEQIRMIAKANRFKKIIIDGKEKLTPAINEDVDVIETTFQQIEQSKLHISDTTYNDFLNALTRVKKSISDDELLQYSSWTNEFGHIN